MEKKEEIVAVIEKVQNRERVREREGRETQL